jgi:hypothetical protein
MKILWMFTIAVLVCVSPCMADNPVKESGKEIGQGFRKIGQDTGKAFKEGGKEVGQGFRKLGKETGKVVKESSKETGQAAKKGGRSMGEWFRDLGHSFKKFFAGP